MNKTYLIFKHEFLHTIKKTGFIIMTFSVPILALLAIGLGHLVSSATEPRVIKIKTIGYVDQGGKFNRSVPVKNTKLVPFKTRQDATQALIRREVSEYVVIPANYTSTGRIQLYTLRKQLDEAFFTRAAIKKFITGNLLEGKVPADIISLVKANLNLEVTRLTETGEIAVEKSGIGNIIISTLFGLLLGLSLMLNSNYLLQGLGEEKESRLIEVLLSSVYVRQLLTGKVLGLGAAGLTQVLVWLGSVPLLLKLAPSSINTFISSIHISPYFYVLGTLYFILGYLLFAVLSIGIGAISPNAREGQLLAMIYTLCSFVPLWLLSLLLMFPNSPVWTALTIFPITAPVQAMIRLGMGEIPAWQLLISMVVLALSIVVCLLTAIKIFRVHLLMHGKRPAIKEIIHNLKNS